MKQQKRPKCKNKIVRIQWELNAMISSTFSRRVITFTAALLLAAIAVLGASSCGGSEPKSAPVSEEGAKLPPAITEDSMQLTTGSGNLTLQGGDGTTTGTGTGQSTTQTNQTSQTKQSNSTPGASAELAGARFKVVRAARPDSNKVAITTSQREVKGDYLEVELEVVNDGSDLVDLSQYSFRLSSPGIEADQYEEYYGMVATYGKYVSENLISAILLDYSNLQPAIYKLKIGETVSGVFLFFDLNPKSTARNSGVAKEGTNLVIRKQRGDNSGEEVEINLAGYPD
jgi:hypothetical protein